CVTSLVCGGALLDGDAVPLGAPDPEDLVRHEPPVGIVEVAVAVVAVEHRELGAVDAAKLVRGDAEHERDERIDLDEGLATVGSASQRGIRGQCCCYGGDTAAARVLNSTRAFGGAKRRVGELRPPCTTRRG